MPRREATDAPDTAQAIELTAGAIERRTNGDVRAWSLEAAQTEARRLAVMLDGGTDPRGLERKQAADKQAQAAAVLESDRRAAMTFGEVWRACRAARKPYWGERQYQDQLTLGDAGGVKPQRGKPDTPRGPRRSFASLCEWLDIPGGNSAQIQIHAPQGVREQNYIRRPLDLPRVHHEKMEAWILEQARIEFDARPPGLVASACWPGNQHPSTCPNVDKCVPYTQMISNDLIRDMQRAGWQLDRVNGSHHVFKHPSRPGIVVVPHPKKDLGLGLVKAIRRQAGI